MKNTPEDAIIYYLSGTGNSYRAACWIAEASRRGKLAARITSIHRSDPRREIPADCSSLVALVTPTHGFTAPWLMIKFASCLPWRRGTPALVVATRGGTKLGRWHLPGMEGTACWLLALLLVLKGYKLRGVTGLDMPVNWTAVHPGLSDSTARSITKRAHRKIDSLMERIISGKSLLTGAIPLALGLLLLPISLLYLLVGRLWLAKLFFASHQCTGCGSCAAGCPAHAIRMLGSKTRRPYWTFACESCMHCMNACPERAIEASYSFAVASYFITAFPAWLLLLNWAGQQWTPLEAFNSFWMRMILKYLYMLMSVALAYVVFILLARVSMLARVFAITTPTHYYRRYHEPDTDLSDVS